METSAPAPDQAPYRQFLRITFDDVSMGLHRSQHQLSRPSEVRPTDVVDQLARRVKHLGFFVDALSRAATPIEPTLSPHLHMAYTAGLATIDRCLAAGDAVKACKLAHRLLALLTVEMSWMPKP